VIGDVGRSFSASFRESGDDSAHGGEARKACLAAVVERMQLRDVP
jgi:hypothetical protein